MAVYYFPEDDPDFPGVISYSPIDNMVCPEKPFGDVSAEEFLAFARDDLARGDRAGLVNALGNAKRSFHYHTERLLYRFGLRDATELSAFPMKTELLRDLRIVSGTLLRVFNRERNAMEHDYVVPTAEIAEGSIDLCELYLLATERFLTETPARLRVVMAGDERGLIFLLEPGSSSVTKFRVVGSKMKEEDYGKVYEPRLYKLASDELTVGLSIEPLPSEEVQLTSEKKQAWLGLLRMFSAAAREKRHRQHPEEPLVIIQHAVPWEDVKSVFQAMDEEDDSV